jgi:hypothetical protein
MIRGARQTDSLERLGSPHTMKARWPYPRRTLRSLPLEGNSLTENPKCGARTGQPDVLTGLLWTGPLPEPPHQSKGTGYIHG